MFRNLRTYVPILSALLMGLFFVSLALDEYSDVRHALQDSRIEACMELETEDYEWDEGDLSPVSPEGRSILSFGEGCDEVFRKQERGFISDKQKLGLVRRYAPRKGIASHNYTLTYLKTV